MWFTVYMYVCMAPMYHPTTTQHCNKSLLAIKKVMSCIHMSDTKFHITFLQDVLGCTRDMDFILWPRNDLEGVTCFLFSRWKDDSEAEFKHIEVSYLM
jgi:hypothetical protein